MSDPHPAQVPAPEAKKDLHWHCMNCGKTVENQGFPSMSGPPRNHWVHVLTGRSSCYPKRGHNSPSAVPSRPQPHVPSGYVTWDQTRQEMGLGPQEELMIAEESARFLIERMNENRGAYGEKDNDSK